MILVSQSYIAATEERREELRRCRESNEKSGVFERVEYLDGSKHRLSFNELLAHCQDKHRGKLCVISNSDIMFGSSAYSLAGLRQENRIVALTRWEKSSGPRFLGFIHEERFFSGSQDSWAFVAGSVPTPDIDIPLGVVGCDQVIVGWAVRMGVEILNPSLSIRTMHLHATPADRSGECESMSGFFGYPEMTAMNLTGDVLCHHWPSEEGKWEFKWQLFHTKK